MSATTRVRRASWAGCALLAISLANAQQSPEPALDSPQLCPVPKALTAEQLAEAERDLYTELLQAANANALVGVDALGRVAIALDLQKDGIADQLLLFTGPERFEGPWSKQLHDASVNVRKGTVLVTSRQEKFAISLAAATAAPPLVPTWATTAIVHESGKELVRVYGEKGGQPMNSLDHASVKTWPTTFFGDLLDPNTGGCPNGIFCCPGEVTCAAGGPGSSTCGIGGCTGSPSSCNVSGCIASNPPNFACCNCETEGANCRCVQCYCGQCN